MASHGWDLTEAVKAAIPAFGAGMAEYVPITLRRLTLRAVWKARSKAQLLLADHCRRTAPFRAKEGQHFTNRIGDCTGAAACVKQADRAGICRDILNHQRAGVPTV